MTGPDNASSPGTPPKRTEWLKLLVIPVLVAVIGGLLVVITTPAGAAMREFLFPTRVAVTGIVQSDGAPVSGARVRVGDDGPDATTDDAGRFQLSEVEDGRHRLRVEAAAIRSHTHEFSLASGAATADLGVIKVSPYLRLGYYASIKPPTRPSGDPRVKYDVTLWLYGGDDAMRTVRQVSYTRPAPLPRDEVRGADLARSFCYRVQGSVRFSDLMVLGGAFAAAQGTVRLADDRSFDVAAVPGSEQPPDCKSAKGPAADDLPDPVPVPNAPRIPNPVPDPDLNPNPVRVAIPEVAGMTGADAERELTDAGFEPQTRREPNESAAEGEAIGTVPPAGTRQSKGSTVLLLVSSGPTETCDSRTVPNVIGRTEAAATARLQCSGFTVGVVEGSGGTVGTVVGQFPTGGTSVEPGSKVSIKVVVE